MKLSITYPLPGQLELPGIPPLPPQHLVSLAPSPFGGFYFHI